MKFAMVQNSLTTVGFLLLILADILWVKGKRATPVHAAGYLVVGGSLCLLVLAPGPWWPLTTPAGTEPLQAWKAMSPLLAVLLVIAATISAALLFWSVFIEIGIARKKTGLQPTDTYSGGTYGLCRHPGFWWFSFFVVTIGAVKSFSAYFPTISLLIVFDLLLIFIQDHYTFPKIFRKYDDYRKSVPFLIPRKKAAGSRGN
jgi:protein-S-isoprenylcysteine O-methyltransferase Ste14